MNKLLTLFLALAFSGMAMAEIDLNTASKAELETVKGIGSQKAEAILEYRKKNGLFKTVDELKKVKGFGDKSVANMRSELSVETTDNDKLPKVGFKKETKPVLK